MICRLKSWNIISQAEYRSVLEGLLQPQADQRGSAEHTSSDCDSADNTIDSERSTDHTRSSRLKFSGTSTRRANPSSSSFAKVESTLFGEEFKDNLVKKVEADSAISKAVNIVNRCTSSSAKLYQRPPRNDHSFHGSRASQYGAASGRRRSPYRYQGKGKYTPGKSYIRKGNIFDRLGSNQTEKRSGNNPNQQPQHK